MVEQEESVYEKRTLTGNFYFRTSLWGMVLMVEALYTYPRGDIRNTRAMFERASLTDMYGLGLATSPKLTLEKA